MSLTRGGAICLLALLALTGCALDSEEEVRAQLKPWLFLSETMEFVSQDTCTVARFALSSGEVKSTAPRAVSGIRDSLAPMQARKAVLFDLPGLSPNDVSEQLNSISLFRGLGVISSFIGPSRRCMSEEFALDAFAVLMAVDSVMIYDIDSNAMVLIDPAGTQAFYMRGNIQ
jgi:hypothetical protein